MLIIPSEEAFSNFLTMDYVTASLRALFEGLDGHELIIPSRAETNPGWEKFENASSDGMLIVHRVGETGFSYNNFRTY
jgi:hypothetical protein